ncbi:hypothetical protein HPB52_013793 [Rhipicephalus sanguineus]|uniref:HTH psq-type domain-containing protein n=1 Tax=Rhipicephalus sanguineus TaxID=34632 RepID=A0A9D4PZX8_RHISA|nr:hypothetical protein HPB52_013793 [Rhipicephalus sanguineus]
MEPMEPNASANAVRHKATKRKQISLKDKLDIIEQVEKGKKQVDIAVAYGLSKQTVSTIINAKEAILAKKQKRDSVIDLKFAMQVLSTVWAQIQPGIIKNCFRKAGFQVDSDCTDCLPQEDQPNPGVWSAVEEAFGSQQFSDYVTADDDLVSSEQLTDEEIVALIRQAPNAEQEEEQNEEGNTGIVTEKVTTSQALDYIQGLKTYFEQQATTSDEMNTLVMMETRIVSKAVRHTVQAKLTSFFQNI